MWTTVLVEWFKNFFLINEILKNKIYKLILAEITKRGSYLQAPRFSPDGKKFVFLRSPVGGPHIRGAQLVMFSWPEKQVKLKLFTLRL